MLYNLLTPLSDTVSFFNVFRYITFRTAYATVTALIITMLMGEYIINKLRDMQLSQKAKGYEPERHREKEGTPTMGGLLIIFSGGLATLLWADLTNPYIWIVLFALVGTGLIGFADDYVKTVRKNPEGIPGLVKLGGQVTVAVLTVVFVLLSDKGAIATNLYMPFFKNLVFDLAAFYVVFGVFVVVGTSNAVNLTDGLDGLAIMPSVIAFGTFMLFVYLSGNINFAEYLQIPYIRGSGEVSIFCGAMVGAGLGFLWFNAFPASVFMGDVGSLSIGAALGAVALVAKHEIQLAIVGGIFVMETASVILQVGIYKMTSGRRLFRMAPIHHHFELKGWSEPKIIVRFWIISFVLALVALSTLKLR